MDEADITAERMQVLDEAMLANAKNKAAEIPAGSPGECDMCGEWSGRLVKGICAPCRDKYKIG